MDIITQLTPTHTPSTHINPHHDSPAHHVHDLDDRGLIYMYM